MVRVILRGPNEAAVKAYAGNVGELLRQRQKELRLEARILGPAPCLLTRLKANFRYHLQLTSADLSALQQLWRSTELDLPNHPQIEYVVDVDPLNLR